MSTREAIGRQRRRLCDVRSLAAIALPPLVLGAVLAGSLAAMVACVLWAAGDARSGLLLAAGLPGVLALRWARRVVGRSTLAPAPGAVALTTAAPLVELSIAEASRLGVGAPSEVRVTLHHSVRVVPVGGPARTTALEIGLPWIAGASVIEVRAEIGASLVRDGDRLTRALVWLQDHMVRPRRPIDRALAEREARLAAGISGLYAIDFERARSRALERTAAFSDYWTDHVRPCLAAGYRPPIIEGWRRYLGIPEGAEALAGLVTTDDLERRILAATAPQPAHDLVALELERVAHAVLIPHLAEELADVVPLATTVGELSAVAPGASDLERSQLGACLALSLHEAGWRVLYLPGQPVIANLDDTTLLPFAVPFAMDDVDARQRWDVLVEDLDLAELPLRHAGNAAARSEEAIALAHVASLRGRVPEGDTVLHLESPPGLRRRTAIALASGLVPGMACVALLAWEAASLDVVWMAHVALGAMALGSGALLIAWVASRIRTAWSSGRLTLGEDRLLLEHPGLLREPWEIDAASLRAVVVDDGNAPRGGSRPSARFAFGDSAWDQAGSPTRSPTGWLWVDKDDPFVPVLVGPGQIPNVALLFDPAPRAPRVRRVEMRGPLPGEALGGLLLAVKNPAAAEPRLHERGLVRPLTTDDVRTLQAIFIGADHDAQAGDRPAEVAGHEPRG